MKLSISNIIWKKGKDNFEDFLKVIVANNIFAVELSLNSIFEEPLNMTQKDFIWLKELFIKYNVSVSALHSLTYTRPDLEIFNTKEKREELLSYLLNYIEIAKKLNTKNLVYGSPKSRQLYDYSIEEANNIFISFLSKIDIKADGINFNIEPLPKLYCDYLNTFMDGVDILKKSDFKNIFIQLDIRSIIESEENIDEIFNYDKYIRHVHIGEPNLTMPSEKYANIHLLLNTMLLHMRYNGYLSIEVLNHNQNNFETYTKYTIDKVMYYYGK